MRTPFLLAVLGGILALGAVGCSSKKALSDDELAKKIMSKETALKAVKITQRIQERPDNFRSPKDVGMTYVVRTKVTTDGGTDEVRVYDLFIAHSDGWVSVIKNDQ